MIHEINENYEWMLKDFKLKPSKFTAFDLFNIVNQNREQSDIDYLISILWPDHNNRSFELMYGNFYIMRAAVELVCKREPKRCIAVCKHYQK